MSITITKPFIDRLQAKMDERHIYRRQMCEEADVCESTVTRMFHRLSKCCPAIRLREDIHEKLKGWVDDTTTNGT